MSKRLSSKHKIDRRLGVNLWGRAKSPLNRREYGPGQHGQRRKKPTDFGVQLMAKQKLKGYYGNIGEKQFRRYYDEAVRRRGDTGENLIALLERRLDAVVYRMKFVPTVFAARQIVNHGHVLVNGRRVNIASYQVKDGDDVPPGSVITDHHDGTADFNWPTSVGVDELLTAITIALGNAPLGACRAAACAEAPAVTVDCLTRAVGAALTSCP